MSKLTESLASMGIHNAHEFARDKGKIVISYTPNGTDSRDLTVAHWTVWGRDINTFPQAPWYDHGSKTFGMWEGAKKDVPMGQHTHAELKAGALKAAQKWAEEKYGIKEWTKTPFGDWMDSTFVRERIKELNRLLQEKATQKAKL